MLERAVEPGREEGCSLMRVDDEDVRGEVSGEEGGVRGVMFGVDFALNNLLVEAKSLLTVCGWVFRRSVEEAVRTLGVCGRSWESRSPKGSASEASALPQDMRVPGEISFLTVTCL